MARRKKSHQKRKSTSRGRRRGRVGAISNDQKTMLIKTAGGIVGAVLGSYGAGVVKTQMDKSDSLSAYSGYAASGVQIVGGLLLPKIIKKTSPFMEGVQLGLMINGGLSVVGSLGILPGVGGIKDYYVPMVGNTPMRSLEDVRSSAMPFVGGAGMPYGAAAAAAAGLM